MTFIVSSNNQSDSRLDGHWSYNSLLKVSDTSLFINNRKNYGWNYRVTWNSNHNRNV